MRRTEMHIDFILFPENDLSRSAEEFRICLVQSILMCVLLLTTTRDSETQFGRV